MNLKYKEEKTTQAASIFIEKEGGTINYMKLLKLLYLADRFALTSWERPITFDWYYSMPHGPVLSFTLDRIHEEPSSAIDSYWHKYISISEDCIYTVFAKGDVPKDQLSDAECELIEKIYSDFGHKNQWELSEYSHTLPEWRDPQGSSFPISISDILECEGWTEEDVSNIQECLEAEQSASEWLS